MMRIAIVSTYPSSKGSLNEYAFHFVHHLRMKPEVDEVIILADELPDGKRYVYESDLPEDKAAKLTIHPSWCFGANNNFLRIRKMVKQVKPDVVLFNLQFASFGEKRVSAALGLLAPMLTRMAGFPTVVLLHNIMETVDLKKAGFGESNFMMRATEFFGEIFTRLLLRANWVAVTIPKYVEILEAKYKADNVFLAPHGAFQEMPRPEFKLPNGAMQVMTFGKFGTYKKVELLIEAFKRLQDRMDQPLELVIAGSDNPNAKGYLERVREQYADVPNIRFTGYVPEEDVPGLFQDAAVVVFPYNSTTGSSGVLHQAGSYGNVAVLPNLGDFAELIQEEGYVAEFFDPDNVEQLANAIEHYLLDQKAREEDGLKNYFAACGLPMSSVIDWYLLHFEMLIDQNNTQKSYAQPLTQEN